MAKTAKTTRSRSKDFGSGTSFNERIRNSADGVLNAVRILLGRKLKTVDDALVEHGNVLSDHDNVLSDLGRRVTRIEEIEEEGPLAADQLTQELVQKHQGEWAKHFN